jgi:hypothetical protein
MLLPILRLLIDVTFSTPTPDYAQNPSMSAIAFHEKAGRSQVGSFVFSLNKVFLLPSRPVAILPSALFVSDCFARCKLGRRGANLFHCRSPLSLVPQSTSITWERTPHPVRRPAFSSHLISPGYGCFWEIDAPISRPASFTMPLTIVPLRVFLPCSAPSCFSMLRS